MRLGGTVQVDARKCHNLALRPQVQTGAHGHAAENRGLDRFYHLSQLILDGWNGVR